MIKTVSHSRLYRFVKSNNNNARLIHIVKNIVSINGDSIVTRLMCGNSMGTQRKLSFYLSNEESPCKRCAEIELQPILIHNNGTIMNEIYTPEQAGSGQFGVCIKCGKGPTKEGHDGCLGTLPGSIMNACCGHGNDRQAYIQYWNKDRISGNEAILEQSKLLTQAYMFYFNNNGERNENYS